MLTSLLEQIESLKLLLANQCVATEPADSDFWSQRKQLFDLYEKTAGFYLSSGEYLNALRMFENCRDLYRKSPLEERLNLYCKKLEEERDVPTDLDGKSAEELYFLGLQAHSGTGRKINYVAAKAYYSASAAKHYPKAQNALGELYETCKWLGIDKNQQVYWYRLAAENNLPRAYSNYGDCFEHAIGIDESFAMAFEWYRKADLCGDLMGQVLLAHLMLNHPKKVPNDFKLCFHALKKASKQGSIVALNDLGAMYYRGYPGVVEQSFETASQYYLQAADLNDHMGQVNLGLLYYKGDGVLQSFENAFKWIKKAAEKEKGWPWYFLGQLYLRGEGVKENLSEAVHCYRKAHQLKNAEAKNKLTELYLFNQVPLLSLDAKSVRQDYVAGITTAKNALEFLYVKLFKESATPEKNISAVYHILIAYMILNSNFAQLECLDGEHFNNEFTSILKIINQNPLAWVTEFIQDNSLPLKFIEAFIKKLFEIIDDFEKNATQDFQEICFLLADYLYTLLPKFFETPTKHSFFENIAITLLEKISRSNEHYPEASAILIDLRSHGDTAKWTSLYATFFTEAKVPHPLLPEDSKVQFDYFRSNLENYIAAGHPKAMLVKRCLESSESLPVLVAAIKKLADTDNAELNNLKNLGCNLMKNYCQVKINHNHDDDGDDVLTSDLSAPKKSCEL